ncbi:MAG: outer membrane lipoprotein-sorting protein [Gammaproteobacteria bacterium]
MGAGITYVELNSVSLNFSKVIVVDNKKISLFVFFLMVFLGLPASAAELNANQIVEQCGYKYPGDDQRSTFTVKLIDKQGLEKKRVYVRLWRDFKGEKGVADKMLLFTEYPPKEKDFGFMRVAFIPEKNKVPDQTIYMPQAKRIRQVTVRDKGDNFLESDLTHADVSGRSVGDDEHRLLGIKTRDHADYYVVESLPKEKEPLYSKRIQWFKKTAVAEDCAVSFIEYYDKHGDLLKEQGLTWQQVNGAWVWDHVTVRNVQRNHTSEFIVSDVQINIGIKDRIFSERTLKKGLSSIR